MDIPSNAQGSPNRDFRRILSEPLFNRLRDKLHKIRRKRASSEPISLEAIRQRKFSLQNTASFQVGQPSLKVPKKRFSLDSALGTDGRVVTPPLPSKIKDRTSDDETAVRETSEETLSASPPPEEHERIDNLQSAADNSTSVGKRQNLW